MRYSAIAEATPEGEWVVAVPSLRGAVAQGEGWAGADYMVRDRIATLLDALIETVQVTLTEVGTGGVDSIEAGRWAGLNGLPSASISPMHIRVL